MTSIRTWIAASLGLSLVGGVAGCGRAPVGSSFTDESESTAVVASDSLEGFDGDLRFELVQSPTARVRFYWLSGAPLVEFTGNLDEDADLMVVHDQAQKATSLEEMHHVLAPEEATPAVLLEMDEAAALAEDFLPAEFTHVDSTPEDTPEVGAAGDNSGRTVLTPERTTARLEPATAPSSTFDLTAWDWAGEADWWEDNFCNLSNNKRCTTNRTWSYSGGFCSGGSTGTAIMAGMSASFESSAEIRYYEYTCGQCWLIGTCCGWNRSFTATATPRQWRRYTRSNTAGKAFEVEGLGSTPRVHDANSYNTWNGEPSALCTVQ